jgi:hypothetical protein
MKGPEKLQKVLVEADHRALALDNGGEHIVMVMFPSPLCGLQ